MYGMFFPTLIVASSLSLVRSWGFERMCTLESCWTVLMTAPMFGKVTPPIVIPAPSTPSEKPPGNVGCVDVPGKSW